MTSDNGLKQLAEIFYPNPVYAVGGCVRNALLKMPAYDTDLCGALTPEDVCALADKKNGLKAVPVNPRIGTLKLLYDGKSYEYTTFRKDNYDINGGHRPLNSVFTKDIETDARRRDFTVNALYYDILNDTVIDPVGGCKDLEKRVLKTCDKADITLSQDGLRLMRLVRFAAEYGFEIDADTYSAAEKNAVLICGISGERVRGELLKILSSDKTAALLFGIDGGFSPENADKIAEFNGGPLRGLRLFLDIGLAKYVIPELNDCSGFVQPNKYHKFDVFTHIAKAVCYSPYEIRTAALFHDIGKPVCFKENGNMYRHAAYGMAIAKNRLGQKGLKFPIADINRTLGLICHHMFDIDGKVSESKVRLFVQENSNIVPDLIELKKADYRAKGVNDDECFPAVKMNKIYQEMKREEVPFAVSELKINGNDLKRTGCKDSEIGETLKAVLKACANDSGMLNAEAQLEAALKLSKHKKD